MNATPGPPPAPHRLVADLLADDQVTPPGTHPAAPHVRSALLAQARHRSAAWPMPEAALLPQAGRAYVRQVGHISVLGPALLAHDRDRAVLGDWTAADLISHLVAVDALAADGLGLPPDPLTGSGDDVLTRTASAQAHLAAAGLTEALRVWRTQAAAIARHILAGGAAGLARTVPYLSLHLPAGDVVLDRAFETWIHADDLRVGVGLAPRAPDAEDVRAMSDLGVRMLPLTRALCGDGLADADVLLVLTGAGGTWRVGPATAVSVHTATAGEPVHRVVLDALDFCRVAGGRAEPDAVERTVGGDPRLGGHLLRAAALLARP